MAQDFFPKIRVVVIWAERSHSLCVESAWRYQRFLEECGEPPVSGRPMTIVMMPGANHFPHWDEPERTMAFFAEVVNSA